MLANLKDKLSETVVASVTTGTMKSTKKDPVASIVPDDDATWVVESDMNDPWSADNNDWAPEQTSFGQDDARVTDPSAVPYYDYVSARRRSTLPYDHKGVAELYVEDLEFFPEFNEYDNEYDDTAEFAY